MQLSLELLSERSRVFALRLQESSKLRRKHLASLYEYMQSCSKELVYLSGQQERIINRDWSDRMVDPSGVRTEYEVKLLNRATLIAADHSVGFRNASYILYVCMCRNSN